LGTWLPWLVSELIPDILTPLLVLIFALLAFAPDRLKRGERVALVLLATFMIAAQISSLALWIGLLAAIPLALAIRPLKGFGRCGVTNTVAAPMLPPPELAVGRIGAVPAWDHVRPRIFGCRTAGLDRGGPLPGGSRSRCLPIGIGRGAATGKPTHQSALTLLLPPGLAVLLLCVVNLAGHGRFAPAPFGNVFLLARLLADGPAATVLRERCPLAGWRLCAVTDRLPTDSDVFLWANDSPIRDVGGHKAVSAEAGAIILAALRDHTIAVARAMAANSLEQLARMRSGDGLEPWPNQVTPWIYGDFPPGERAAYAAARQQSGTLRISAGLDALHLTVILGGIGLCVLMAWQYRHWPGPHMAFLLIALLVLPISAVVTGALSGPHDRYQARVAMLPALIGSIAAAGLIRRPT